MYDFKQHLQENEKILWEGRPVPKTGSKPIGSLLFVCIFAIISISLLVWSVTNKVGDGANGISDSFIILVLTSVFFLVIALYGLIYYLFLKDRRIAHNFYCLTNLRALKYDSKKEQLYYGYLEKYTEIHCENTKNGFGDLYFSVQNDSDNPKEAIGVIKKVFFDQDPKDMTFMTFESIENPKAVKALLQK